MEVPGIRARSGARSADPRSRRRSPRRACGPGGRPPHVGLHGHQQRRVEPLAAGASRRRPRPDRRWPARAAPTAVSAISSAGVPSACTRLRPPGDIRQKPCRCERISASAGRWRHELAGLADQSGIGDRRAECVQRQRPGEVGAKRIRQVRPPSQNAGRRSTSRRSATKSAQTSTSVYGSGWSSAAVSSISICRQVVAAVVGPQSLAISANGCTPESAGRPRPAGIGRRRCAARAPTVSVRPNRFSGSRMTAVVAGGTITETCSRSSSRVQPTSARP